MYQINDNKIDTLYIQWLKDKGILTKLYRYGYLGPRLATTLEVRLKLNALMRAGYSRGGAVRSIAESMNRSLKTIYSYL